MALPNPPTNLLMVLQGKDTANNNTDAGTPQDPNRTVISWTASTVTTYAIASYNVYRSTDGVNYSLYANTTSTTYTDTAATGCVNGTAGSTAPYYTANTYFYQVTAVDVMGNESVGSGSQAFNVYFNGAFNWGGDYSFGGVAINYSDTAGSPEEGPYDISVALGGAYGGFQPYAGELTTQWNMWAGAFEYLEFDLKSSVSTQTWAISAHRVGDVPIYDDTGSAAYITIGNGFNTYGTFSAGGWVHYKIPITALWTDYGPTGAGPPVLQNAVYKFAIQDQTGNASGTWYVDNIQFVPGTFVYTPSGSPPPTHGMGVGIFVT